MEKCIDSWMMPAVDIKAKSHSELSNDDAENANRKGEEKRQS